jgi:hypothetical protein
MSMVKHTQHKLFIEKRQKLNICEIYDNSNGVIIIIIMIEILRVLWETFRLHYTYTFNKI